MEGDKENQPNRAPGIIEFCKAKGTVEAAREYLRAKGLLARVLICGGCNIAMSLVPKDSGDGEMFLCTKCWSKTSIRRGSFFEKSKLALGTLMMIVYCFCLDMKIYQCEKLLPEVSHVTVIDWFNFCRDICSRSLIDAPCFINGAASGNVIEIYESLFGKKRKYHRGRGQNQIWVFGAVERDSRNCFMQVVEKRDRDTLLPIVKKYIAPGSTIFSDKWGAYATLSSEGYTHDTVNHSEEFKSSSGCCTNGIEGLWGNAKLRIKKMKGIYPERLPGVLDEYMYRFRFGRSNGDIFEKLLQDIGRYYYLKVTE